MIQEIIEITYWWESRILGIGLLLAEIIVWHDYKTEPGVKEYLDKINNIVHMEDSLISYLVL